MALNYFENTYHNNVDKNKQPNKPFKKKLPEQICKKKKIKKLPAQIYFQNFNCNIFTLIQDIGKFPTHKLNHKFSHELHD